MTEFACLGRIQASVTCVIILARKALVQVETLFLLGASFEEVKFTKLHDLWWIGVVRVMTCLCILWTLSLHEQRTNFCQLFDLARVTRPDVLLVVPIGRSLVPVVLVSVTSAFY